MLKSIYTSFICIIFILQISSCQEEAPFSDRKEIGFVEVSALTEDQNQLNRSRLSDASAKPSQIIITTQNYQSDTLTHTQEIKLYNFNGYWISEQIALLPGEYYITQFLIQDSTGNIIYATPLKGTKLDYLVNNPLSIKFNVKAAEVTKVVTEVISTKNSIPEDFGYAAFSFKIIDTFDLLLTTFSFDTISGNYSPTDAHLMVKSGDSVLYNTYLEAKTNHLILSGNFPEYVLTTDKKGFVTYYKSFTLEELQQYNSDASGPLLINLQADSLAYDPSLIAYYPFDGNAQDEGPLAFHGKVDHATLTHDKYGRAESAYHFNGIDQKIDIEQSDLPVSDQVSVSAWINTSAPTYGMIACKYDWIEDKGFYLYVKDGHANFGGRDNNKEHIKTASVKIVNDGNWHHVVGICNKNVWQVWVDGLLISEVLSNHPYVNIKSDDPLTVGYYFQGNGNGEHQYFNGKIDDIRIYNRPLQDYEIKALFNQF